MPSSAVDQIPFIIGLLDCLRPRTLLDIGIGNGKYGFLCREYFPRMERIDGIEAYPDYVGDLQRSIYSSIGIGPVQVLVRDLKEYDAVLMIDVIEHLDKLEATSVVRTLQDKAKSIVVATPAEFEPQGAVDGNQYEVHKMRVSANDFRRLGFQWVEELGSQRIALWVGNPEALGRVLRYRRQYRIRGLIPMALHPIVRRARVWLSKAISLCQRRSVGSSP